MRGLIFFYYYYLVKRGRAKYFDTTGSILKRGGKYELPGGDIIGYSEEEVINFLGDKVNQDIKLRIKANIDKEFNTKKTK